MTAPDHCDVSFAIACFNAMPYLDEAIKSALDQEGVSVEVIIVDDGSSDDSRECAEAWSRRDERVRLLRTPQNLGPGGARNMAIETMRGTWYAVLDSDDLIDPQRSSLLIARAESIGADLIADGLRVFGEGVEEHDFLDADWPEDGRWVDLESYFASTVMFGSKPNLGFLKPMIRRTTLEQGPFRYDPGLRIAEDDELIVRLLLAGNRYFVLPRPGYRYRKHGASISHRLSVANAERMLVSERKVRECVAEKTGLTGTYRHRWRALLRAVAFTRAIDALKARKPVKALAAIAGTPGAIRLFSMPISARLRRWTKRDEPAS